MLEISKSLDELGSSKPTVILVSAEWCHPCKMLKPTVAKLELYYAGRIGFYILNTDTDAGSEIAARSRISAIPTLIFMETGKQIPKSMLVGVRSEKAITEKIEELLK